MATGTTVSILPCGAMTADLTWLLLAPGRAIRNRQNKPLPAEWVDVPTHCVLVDTPDGKLLWDTSFDGPFNGAHLKADYQGLDFETVDGDAEFLPGVSFIQTPGHTRAACRCASTCPRPAR